MTILHTDIITSHMQSFQRDNFQETKCSVDTNKIRTSTNFTMAMSVGSSDSDSRSTTTANTNNNSNTTKGRMTGKRGGKKPGRKPAKIDERAKLERSRQSAKECRARKKLRYQYLEELVLNREKAVFTLREELETCKTWCRKVDDGIVPADLQEKMEEEKQSVSPLATGSLSNSDEGEITVVDFTSEFSFHDVDVKLEPVHDG